MNLDRIKDFIERTFEYGFSEPMLQNYADFNIPIQFDTGNFGETLTVMLFDTLGAGTSGGCSFDTAAGHEVKTISFLQSTECKKCGFKCNFFTPKCYDCGGSDFSHPQDSRAGISCTSHRKYLDQLDSYIIFHLDPDIYQHSCRSVTLKAYLIKKDDPFFNELLALQEANSATKSKNLTLNIEFWSCAPSRIFEAHIKFGKKTSVDIVHAIAAYDAKEVRPIPQSEFQKNRRYRKFASVVPLMHNPLENDDYGVCAQKSMHGKKRGKVERTNIL